MEPVLCYVDRPWAYFTTLPLDKQWGDDWDDAPYEHNAGEPYGFFEDAGHKVIRVAYDGCFDVPCTNVTNSFYSVKQINRGDVAWLRPSPWNDCKDAVAIHAGVTLSEFKRRIRLGGGKVYVEE